MYEFIPNVNIDSIFFASALLEVATDELNAVLEIYHYSLILRCFFFHFFSYAVPVAAGSNILFHTFLFVTRDDAYPPSKK